MTTTIVFDHRGRTEKGRPGPLEVRVTINRKVYYVSTGIKVLKQEWRFGEVVNRPDAPELNERLQTVMKAVNDEVNDRLERGVAIDVTEIRRAVWGVRSNESDGNPVNATMLGWMEEQIALLDVTEGTRKHYYTTLVCVRMCGFLNRWRDLTTENIYRFDAFVRARMKPQSEAEKKMKAEKRPIDKCTVYNYHKHLKALLNRAVKMGKIDANPYDRLKGEFGRGDKETIEFLTEDEVSAIESLHPVPGSMMATARDLFVFQLYTGLSYSDTQKFDIKNYKKVIVDGSDDKKTERWVSVGERVKTGVPYIAHLLPPVVEVLERYGWQVPKINDVKYNKALKDIGTAVGITTRMHSHLARHTFATWMLRNGVKVENLKQMLGHRRIEQTMRYAKVLAESVHEDFEMIERKMQKSGQ